MKSRDRFPPGGWKYYQPESRFSAPPNSSFESVVAALIQHRGSNRYLVETHGWSIDPNTVRDEVDSFNARICEQLGYKDYIYEGGTDPAPPKTTPQPASAPGRLAAGAGALVEWLKSGAEAVPAALANHRASVCATCPQNGKGDYTRYFTVPVSEAIRHELNRRKEWDLVTSYDDQLNVCEACLCPLKLKVHLPIGKIASYLDQATQDRLDHRCWITKEKP